MAEKEETKVDIDGEVFTLDFGCNMACRLEEADGQGRDYADILADATANPTATKMRRIVMAAMLPVDKVTLEHAGKMVDALGGYKALARQWAKPANPEPVAA